MAEVKEVVQIASSFLKELMEQAKNVRLEQVEEVTAQSEWSVILSFPDDSVWLGSSILGTGAANTRVYKEVLVDDKQKKATALKVWKY